METEIGVGAGGGVGLGAEGLDFSCVVASSGTGGGGVSGMGMRCGLEAGASLVGGWFFEASVFFAIRAGEGRKVGPAFLSKASRWLGSGM